MQTDPHLARARDYVARAQQVRRLLYSVSFIEGDVLVTYEVGWRFTSEDAPPTPTLYGKRLRPAPVQTTQVPA